ALKNVPKIHAQRWFKANEDGSVIIDEKLRKEATFRWLNLVDPFPSFRRPFHVIFCRNVMLYFEEEMRSAVIEKLSRSLAPGGWLIIGQAEDSRAARNWLEPVNGSIYRKSNLS
ncbi:MAG: CheR family methyltransferase, partial [Methylocystis sp.]